MMDFDTYMFAMRTPNSDCEFLVQTLLEENHDEIIHMDSWEVLDTVDASRGNARNGDDERWPAIASLFVVLPNIRTACGPIGIIRATDIDYDCTLHSTNSRQPELLAHLEPDSEDILANVLEIVADALDEHMEECDKCAESLKRGAPFIHKGAEELGMSEMRCACGAVLWKQENGRPPPSFDVIEMMEAEHSKHCPLETAE